jgi:hypothetical protein
MIARGFKPVGWVAGVAAAALSCYMLSLNVAAERAELAKLERRIIAAKQDIRELQTELGTRGRLQQLESWNANVLALSAPTSAQYLDNELTLARFEQRDKTMEERAVVQMASADAAQPKPQPQPAPQVQPQPRVDAPVRFASAPSAQEARPLVQRASLTLGDAKAEVKKPAEKVAEPKKAEAKKAEPDKVEPKKAEVKLAQTSEAEPKPAPAKKPALLDQKLVKSIGEAAKAEKRGSAGAQ